MEGIDVIVLSDDSDEEMNTTLGSKFSDLPQQIMNDPEMKFEDLHPKVVESPKEEKEEDSPDYTKQFICAFQKLGNICRSFSKDAVELKIINKLEEKYLNYVTTSSKPPELLPVIQHHEDCIRRKPSMMFVHLKELTTELQSWKVNGASLLNGTDCKKGLDTSVSEMPGTLNECMPGDVPRTGSSTEDTNNLNKKEPSRKHIRKLEKLLKELSRKIKTIEQEDEEFYGIEDQYKKRFVQVWNKLCELTGRKTFAGCNTHRKFSYSGSRYPEINKRISIMINKKKVFPEFSDVYKAIKKVNEKEELHLREQQMHDEAQEIFRDVGMELKQRRLLDFRELFSWHINSDNTSAVDPAELDEQLKTTLEENNRKGLQRIEQVFEEFAQKQMDMECKASEAVKIEKTISAADPDGDIVGKTENEYFSEPDPEPGCSHMSEWTVIDECQLTEDESSPVKPPIDVQTDTLPDNKDMVSDKETAAPTTNQQDSSSTHVVDPGMMGQVANTDSPSLKRLQPSIDLHPILKRIRLETKRISHSSIGLPSGFVHTEVGVPLQASTDCMDPDVVIID